MSYQFGFFILSLLPVLLVAKRDNHYRSRKFLFETLLKILPEKPVIVEAGAHFGQDTIILAKQWPEGDIHAFEPNPESYKKLLKKIEPFSCIKTYQLALSDINGLAAFHQAGIASSLFIPQFNRIMRHHQSNPIQVTCVTLDYWAQENSVPNVDFLWLVVEGAELHVLQGATKILENVQALYLEVSTKKYWENAVLYDELQQWLDKAGFQEVWQYIAFGLHGNVLFIRKQY